MYVPEEISLLQKMLLYEQERPDWVFCSFLDREIKIGHRLNVAGFLRDVRNAAGVLQRKGLHQGDRVVVSLPTSPEFVICYFAIQWLGAIPVPVPEPNFQFKRNIFNERVTRIVADCAPAACIVLPEVTRFIDERGSVPECSDLRGLMLEWHAAEAMDDGDAVASPVLPSPVDIAFLQYTSGSTGSPKGVVVTHSALHANMQGMKQAVELSADDVMVNWMPVYHDMGLIGGLLLPIYAGMSSYLLSTMLFLGRPENWLRAVSKYRATISPGTNYAYSLCARKLRPERIPGLDLSCWKRAVNGAEPIDFETLNAFQRKFEPYGLPKGALYPVFGMAEATLGISFPKPLSDCRIDRILRKALNDEFRAVPAPNGNPDAMCVVGCGTVLPGHRLEIKDPASNRGLGEREVGEICFYGPSVCPAYFHEIKNERHLSARSELRTGDLGYLCDGHLFIVGRLKDVMQIAGANYYPADVEAFVNRITGIRAGRCVAIAVRNAKIGTCSLTIIAELEVDACEEAMRHEIQAVIRLNVGLSVEDVLFVPKGRLPLTTSGKLMRNRCLELVSSDRCNPRHNS